MRIGLVCPSSRKVSVVLFSTVFVVAVFGFSPAAQYATARRVSGQEQSSIALLSTLSPPFTTQKSQEGDDHNKDKSKQVLSSGPLSMTVDELTTHLGGRGRARLVWDCYSNGIDPAFWYDSTIDLGPNDDYETINRLLPSSRRKQRLGPPTLKKLSDLWGNITEGCVEGGVAKFSHVKQSRDGTTKLLLEMSDGLEVETVIIPWNGVRSTLCISSQVGCRQACRFCATGKMGLIRSLNSDEILAQMFWALKLCRWYGLPAISNVVFMGMGEPSDNVEAVIKAAQILTTRELFQLSATRVTVSTVAPTPQAFEAFANAPCVLAWSVHAARDELRRELVPTTRHSMNELRQGLIRALLMRPMSFRTTMLEVVLIDQVNDDIEKDGAALVELSRGIVDAVPGCKLVVNLIPYNDIYSSQQQGLAFGMSRQYKAPSASSVEEFQRYLWRNGIFAHVRATRGDDESAACGQLATATRKKS